MRNRNGLLGLSSLIAAFRWRVGITWAIVVVENVLIALIPLLIGLSIDSLLAGRLDDLLAMGGVLVALGIVAVGRRIYDTRVYGSIRLSLGCSLHRRHQALAISARNARLDMSRELVDFLEIEVPALITAVIQIAVSLAVLTLFDLRLGISSLLVIAGMIVLYAFFHRRFFRLNAALNGQRERQVDVLGQGRRPGLFRHLKALRASEVEISDTEAFVYGGIFLLQIGFLMFNLHLGAHLPGITAGQIFSIAAYTWDYVEAALLLPMALQSWSRLSEITARLNSAAR